MAENREKLSGRTKETAGKLSGDDRLESEGRTERSTAEGKAKSKDALGKVKGAVEGVKESFRKNRG